MKIDILSYAEHARRLDEESAFKQDKCKFPYAHWSRVRKDLLERLSVHGTIDSTEFGDGDFFVGDDWFETGVLHIALMKWHVLTPEFLQEGFTFLENLREDFLITVVKSMPAVEDMFELVVTSRRSYIGFFRKTAMEARTFLTTNESYNAVRAFLT